MVRAQRRSSSVILACLVAAACSSTPTGPSQTNAGPVVASPLLGLIPDGPPPVPPRLSAPMPASLGASRFVALGDSITYGTLSRTVGGTLFVYDVPTHSYPVRLELGLDVWHPPRDYTVINAGVPAERAAEGAQRVQAIISEHRPQGLLVLEGINDLAGGAGIPATVNALDSIVSTGRRNNVTVLVATMPQTYVSELFPDRDNARDLIVPLNSAIRSRFSGRQNVYVVDLWTALGTDHRYIGPDGLHPNEAGYERVASEFLRAIEQVFAVRGSFQ